MHRLETDRLMLRMALREDEPVLEEGFVTLGLNRISAYCVKENAASARVLERAGFRLEGLLRRHVWLADGMKHDVKLYSLNEEEWRSRDEKRTGGQI